MALVREERLRHGEDGREPDARAEEDDGAVHVRLVGVYRRGVRG